MPILWILAAYLVGSFPTAFLLGRLRGVDLRRVGSGNVGGSNAGVFVGRWAFLFVGGVDIAKAALPTWLALAWTGDSTLAALVGLAAIIGHDWSLYLRFAGGRGISGTIGVLLVLFPLGLVVLLLPAAVARLMRREPLGGLVGLCALPVVAAWLAASGLLALPSGVVLSCAGITVLAALKRLLANGEPVPQAGRVRVLRNRLLYDRDVGPDEPWVERGMQDEAEDRRQ